MLIYFIIRAVPWISGPANSVDQWISGPANWGKDNAQHGNGHCNFDQKSRVHVVPRSEILLGNKVGLMHLFLYVVLDLMKIKIIFLKLNTKHDYAQLDSLNIVLNVEEAV